MASLPMVKVKVKVKVSSANHIFNPIPVRESDRSQTEKVSQYNPPTDKGLAIARAKEKYGSEFRQNPPLRERNQWQKFVDRNRSLAKNNYKSTSKHVQQILQTRERVWNTLPHGNKSKEFLSGADALDYRGVIYALVNEDTGDYFHIIYNIYI